VANNEANRLWEEALLNENGANVGSGGTTTTATSVPVPMTQIDKLIGAGQQVPRNTPGGVIRSKWQRLRKNRRNNS
jgi:hypothetical protein